MITSTNILQGSLNDAIHQFEAKFKAKSGLAWANRGDKAKSGKYTFVEKSYTDDSDEEDGCVKAEDEGEAEAIDSKL